MIALLRHTTPPVSADVTVLPRSAVYQRAEAWRSGVDCIGRQSANTVEVGESGQIVDAAAA